MIIINVFQVCSCVNTSKLTLIFPFSKLTGAGAYYFKDFEYFIFISFVEFTFLKGLEIIRVRLLGY